MPHMMPGGGDWAIHRGAALLVEGSEQLLVQNCTFERVDGGALMLSAYNRDATIRQNEFLSIGESAIALLGNTSFPPSFAASWPESVSSSIPLPIGFGPEGGGARGPQPRGTTIVHNWAEAVGVFEKQTSFVTQFKSCRTNITENIL